MRRGERWVSSWRQSELLPLLPTENIVVEKVSVDQGLDCSAAPRQPLILAMLCEISPYPVENVKCAISTKTENVMRGDVFNLASLLK